MSDDVENPLTTVKSAIEPLVITPGQMPDLPAFLYRRQAAQTVPVSDEPPREEDAGPGDRFQLKPIPVDLLKEAARYWTLIQDAQANLQRARKDFRSRLRGEYWLPIAWAIGFGRAKVMAELSITEPTGRRYNAAIGEFLNKNGLRGIHKVTRSRLAEIAEHLPEIRAWYNQLDAADRIHINNPATILKRWRQDTNQIPASPSPLAKILERYDLSSILEALSPTKRIELEGRLDRQREQSLENHGLIDRRLTNALIKLAALAVDGKNPAGITLAAAAVKQKLEADGRKPGDLGACYRDKRKRIV
jgi:hypothetical protein